MVSIVTTVDDCHKNSRLLIIVTIAHDFQNSHTCHNCSVTIVFYQHYSQLQKIVKICSIDHNCHNYLILFTIIQSQLLFVTICNNFHNFLELPQLVIIFIILNTFEQV